MVNPAENTPVTSGLRLAASHYEELPPGLLNFVVGEIGDALAALDSEIYFLHRFAPRSNVSAGVGRQCSSVVPDDADLERAFHEAIVARFLQQGHVCMSANRIIVDAKLHDHFVEAFIERSAALKIGNTNELDTMIEPLINVKPLKVAIDRVTAAQEPGDHFMIGEAANGQIQTSRRGVEVADDLSLAQPEQSAPIPPPVRGANEDDSLRMAHDTEYGLSSAILTSDEANALRIEAGMTQGNNISPINAPNNMFGAEKKQYWPFQQRLVLMRADRRSLGDGAARTKTISLLGGFMTPPFASIPGKSSRDPVKPHQNKRAQKRRI